MCVQVCYMGQDCSVGVGTVTSSGPGTRLKCAACSVVTHLACMDKVPERLRCKKTFIDGVRSYRDHQGETRPIQYNNVKLNHVSCQPYNTVMSRNEECTVIQ